MSSADPATAIDTPHLSASSINVNGPSAKGCLLPAKVSIKRGTSKKRTDSCLNRLLVKLVNLEPELHWAATLPSLPLGLIYKAPGGKNVVAVLKANSGDYQIVRRLKKRQDRVLISYIEEQRLRLTRQCDLQKLDGKLTWKPPPWFIRGQAVALNVKILTAEKRLRHFSSSL